MESAARIETLTQAAKDGQIVLAYLDESGFYSTPKTRSAWSRVTQPHCAEPLRDGICNVIGAILSTGDLFAIRHHRSTTAALIAGFIEELAKTVAQPLIIILDNASIHTAKIVKEKVSALPHVRLEFLAPYSPELNRIEGLWRKMKYEWLAFKARNSETLVADLDSVICGFGSVYHYAFY
jgi:transposase